MGYDSVISQTHQFGPHQRRIFPLLCLVAMSSVAHKLGGVFLMAKPDFRCLLPQESPENAIYQFPPNITNATHTWSYETENWPKCERYDSDLAHPYNATGENLKPKPSTAKCDSFVYDKTQYTRTATTEWDLVCDNAWLKTLSDSLLMFGDLPGVLFFSSLSDRYGRKAALLSGVTIQLISGLLAAASPVFIALVIFRFFVGLTMSGMFLIAYVTAIEMVSPENRRSAAAIINLSYFTGNIFIAGLAYFIANWRNLQIVFCIPSIAFLIFSRHVPESARWLLSKGRVQEAKDILEKEFVTNGVELSQDTFDSLLEEKSKDKPVAEKTSMFDIFRYPSLRKKSLLLSVLWFFISLTYYGILLNTSNLGGNDYLNFLIAGVLEIPTQIFVLLTIDRFGRKIILCGSMFLSGISLILTIFVPSGMTWLLILLAMMGKLTISVSYATVYVFTSEQYPTTVRNVGVGACSAVARIAGAIAPYLNYLFEIATYLPLVILGSCALVAGLLSLLLPETLNQKLPETIEESEKLGEYVFTRDYSVPRYFATKKKTERDIEKSENVDIGKLSNE